MMYIIAINIYVDDKYKETIELSAATNTWSQVNIDLSDYCGENDIQIEFCYGGMDADNWLH